MELVPLPRLILTIDAQGDFYVTEFSAHRIREITPAGVVTTIAGSGSAGGSDGTGTSASFNNPSNPRTY